MFLGFRNSACFDRWWEARKQLGLHIAAARDLARQSLLLEMREAGAERRELLYLTIAFTHAMVKRFRPTSASIDIGALLSPETQTRLRASTNPPAFLLQSIGQTLSRLRVGKKLSAIEYSVFDATAMRMNGVLASCERIHGTPVPFGYTLLLLRTAYIFCLLVPFGFADLLGWTTPIAAVVFGYTFFGLDALGDELEEPFGDLPNDLPLHAIAMTVELSLRESLGVSDLPPQPKPIDYVLMRGQLSRRLPHQQICPTDRGRAGAGIRHGVLPQRFSA